MHIQNPKKFLNILIIKGRENQIIIIDQISNETKRKYWWKLTIFTLRLLEKTDCIKRGCKISSYNPFPLSLDNPAYRSVHPWTSPKGSGDDDWKRTWQRTGTICYENPLKSPRRRPPYIFMSSKGWLSHQKRDCGSYCSRCSHKRQFSHIKLAVLFLMTQRYFWIY